MRINPKSQKGAITLIVLVTMLFLMAFLMSLYIKISNKAQTSAETTSEIAKKYNNIGDADTIYNSYFATEDVIPIYNVEQLKKIGSDEQIDVNGKIYTFESNATYILKNDLDLGGYDDENNTWLDEKIWKPLNEDFTGILDGLGNTLTGLYIGTEGGLFGETLNGTVKNINILESSMTGYELIASENKGVIENCYTGYVLLESIERPGYNATKNTDDILTENAKYVITEFEEEKVAIIPKGFTISTIEEEQSITNGLVIKDVNENEFVWVPVNLTGTDEEKGLAFEKIRTTYEDTDYAEPYTSGYDTEVEEYDSMKASVIENGGFYIGRYETGTSDLRYGINNGTSSDLVIKKGAYLYNYISWGTSMADYTSDVTDLGGLKQGKGAVYLSKNMYTDYDTYGVISTLCYGVQWDAAMSFIEDETYSITNSLTWGNYTNSAFTFTGKYSSNPASSSSWTSATSASKSAGSKWLMTTGASEQNKAKNIYDLAGNVAEWTMESNAGIYRVRRGGHRAGSEDVAYAALRENFKPDNSLFSYGFRVALYIKE